MLETISRRWWKGWAPPEKVTPSEWVERYRILPASVSAEPGPMRLDRTPYVREILNTFADPTVEELVWVKPTQVGGSESLRNMIGYAIDNDPGPTLVVMPDEKSAKDTIDERIRPMCDASPRLRRHVSPRAWDNKLDKIRFDSMDLYVGWAGSPQSIASRPCRNVFFDECDKYPAFSGREADPISLGTERTKTYGHRRKVVKTSTPTTREGAIQQAFEGCGDRRYYEVPCPHCGTFQRLKWAQVKWPKGLVETDKVKKADQIEQGRLAWYECEAPTCGGRMDDRHKPKMLTAGRWVNETGQTSKRVGFHLSALYSPWVTFGAMVAQFVRAEGDLGATMNFRNSWLAEPFEQQIRSREPSKIRDKATYAGTMGRAARVVPDWAVLLIATADVQKDHLYYTVTAWGYELRSKRVWVGVAATFDEVYRQVFNPDVPFVAETAGGSLNVSMLVLDSGYRKDEVTDFAKRDPSRVQIAKGLSTYFGPIAEAKAERASGVVVWNINTMQSKDTLDRLIADPDPDKWQVYPEIGDEFCMQMASEHKVLNPQSKRFEWKEKTSGAANHFWDCEAMACAVATAMGAAIPKPSESPAVRQASGGNVATFGGQRRW